MFSMFNLSMIHERPEDRGILQGHKRPFPAEEMAFGGQEAPQFPGTHPHLKSPFIKSFLAPNFSTLRSFYTYLTTFPFSSSTPAATTTKTPPPSSGPAPPRLQ
eukprot:Phypoly_transcript_14483.p1 GENE.Phypoly_transcript_14483~~Phypoly_transcript_14483.p1  ORF type:complete len:103 (+),score=21.18 Phypoly_transcript_14483:101-409(+)